MQLNQAAGANISHISATAVDTFRNPTTSAKVSPIGCSSHLKWAIMKYQATFVLLLLTGDATQPRPLTRQIRSFAWGKMEKLSHVQNLLFYYFFFSSLDSPFDTLCLCLFMFNSAALALFPLSSSFLFFFAEEYFHCRHVVFNLFW